MCGRSVSELFLVEKSETEPFAVTERSLSERQWESTSISATWRSGSTGNHSSLEGPLGAN